MHTPSPKQKMAAFLWTAPCWLMPRRGMASGPRSLYDALGVTPRASSKQIKAAYFRLSKKHHPDRSSGDSLKFQEISAAYEVLGSRQKRRIYDSGLAGGAAGDEPARRQPRAAHAGRGAPFTGRTDHFHYDAWSQAHYADLRWRERNARDAYAKAAEKRRDRRNERTRGFVGCFLLLAFTGYLLLTEQSPRGNRTGAERPARPPS
ncbi:dnaJ homolog subfamily C member 30, mitochondrial-like [Pollicipes pollicipes]|uniref:dnaJ homolog subfamily C member 30, mitochondrial-like n=1 Tax=Pollicipes pollicipes TaxID=41117 RepID=UPI001884FDB9|nr:dnaJ homolog subfamily C member 30, mitochondrial-like [Pollicipes pollicipes]XP_037092560.1 dnaJ homolog subfamily C member 30, mitochondrial-like [Pollicipes pollicipes]XP_037093156.1 dnaJ homolog subfamily C member 30, mitochondrial-like [Pollicipes pollicipes]